MNIEELNFLKSPEGRRLLDRYRDYSEADLHRLLLKTSKENTPHFLPAIVSQVKLRKKAARMMGGICGRAEGKFSKSQEMFFTPYGLEQATDEKISEIISSRFKKNWKVVDLTSGIGGNLIFLAKNSQKVVAIDVDPVNLECAKENAAVYGVDNKIEFILGDAFDNILKDADAFFIDPSRMREGKTKTRSLLNSEPNILEIIEPIFKVTKNLCVKISPAFDYGEIKLLPEEPEIEIISDDNTCKVTLLWFGEFKTCERRATCIVDDKIFSLTDSSDIQRAEISEKPLKYISLNYKMSDARLFRATNQAVFNNTARAGAKDITTQMAFCILKYIYEPNKAISKARLIDELAKRRDLCRISPQVSFLTSDELIVGEENKLFRIFKMIYCEEFSLNKLKKALKDRNIDRANIIIKKFPLKPEELYKKIKIKEGGNFFIILTPLKNNESYFILAERVSV